ncbi:hypothetical protein TWF718_001248 [Orbilia javanica]|uniref:Uncharacterized protein n=1 Tax=Orbilia javanica TaxID=47235 RepID=A0AAN8RH43_9PEZI
MLRTVQQQQHNQQNPSKWETQLLPPAPSAIDHVNVFTLGIDHLCHELPSSSSPFRPSAPYLPLTTSRPLAETFPL